MDWVRSHLSPRHPLRRGGSHIYRTFLKVKGRRGLVLRFSDEDEFRLDSRFFNIPWQEAEPKVYSWLSQTLHPGMVFFDIGAWVGQFSLLAAKRVGREGRVFAFEPSDTPRGYLERHIRLNAFQDLISVSEDLVGDRHDVQVDFHLIGRGLESSNSLATGTADPLNEAASSTKVRKRMLTVDGFTASIGRTPDVMKIDVEGAEVKVLEGASRTMDEARPVIVCAIHPDWLEALGASTQDVFDIAARHGYVVMDTDGEPLTHLAWQEVLLVPSESQLVATITTSTSSR